FIATHNFSTTFLWAGTRILELGYNDALLTLAIHAPGRFRHEDRSILWRPRHSHSRCIRKHTEAHDSDWRQADPVASDALLQRVWPQRLRLVPRLQGQRRQGILPELQATHLC